MKKVKYLFLIVGMLALFSNCKKEEKDLTIEIVGDYIGDLYEDGLDSIFQKNYLLEIKKINDNRIGITREHRRGFSYFETDINRINSTTIHTPTEQRKNLIIDIEFKIGTEVSIDFFHNPYGGSLRNSVKLRGIKQ